ncbi:MAG: ABC transporter permease [Anaerolineae bacterium]
MRLWHLALRNIAGSIFRSGVVFACALLVAAFTLLTTLLMRGTATSLQLATDRLGADIVVVPSGAELQVSNALLMGSTTHFWMPAEDLRKVAAVEGVEIASPQLYLSTLSNAPCCSVPDMFVVAFDPSTDFTIQPWLVNKIGHGLALGEAVGGQYIFVPDDSEHIYMYGYTLTLVSTLDTTGSGLDKSMFITFETAEDMARLSSTLAVQPLVIPEDKISSIFVRLKPGYTAGEVAQNISNAVPNIAAIKSPELTQMFRDKMEGLTATILAVLGITWALSIALVSLVFSMAANERRRELGVLRAMGASRKFVFGSLFTEAGILAALGGLSGVSLALLVVVMFRELFVVKAGLPYILPELPMLLAQVALGLLITLASVGLAAFIPAYRISHLEPAEAMRE